MMEKWVLLPLRSRERCYKCNEKGHKANACPNAKQKNVNKCNDEHICATKENMRIFVDLAWFKQPVSVDRSSREGIGDYWDMREPS